MKISLYVLTILFCRLATAVPVKNGLLMLTLEKEEAVSIVPAGIPLH